MIRNAFFALAVLAMVASANAAFAGGRSSGSSKSNNQYVRIKNTGSAPALVNAANGSATTATGGKTVSSNGVAQFKIKKGAAQGYAQNQDASASNTVDFTFPKSTYVYLVAQADATTASITFANPGQIF